MSQMRPTNITASAKNLAAQAVPSLFVLEFL
jgi:hypothetical protein